MTIPIRRLFTWKFVFYDLFLPVVRVLGPARGDRVLRGLGRALAWAWPGHRQKLRQALERTGRGLALDGSVESLWPEFAANSVCFLARDYLLEKLSDVDVLQRFEVIGQDAFQRAVSSGRGAMLVASHYGAHLAGLHWLFRSGVPISAMVQRPPHVSRALSRLFDARLAIGPEHDLFLRRGLDSREAVELLLRARDSLRKGRVVYSCGDIPWYGPNCRPGRLLGRTYQFLSIWADLAAITRVPTFHVFCSHLPEGRFRLEFEEVGQVHAGEEALAVADFLRQLEARIANEPTQAVAHLLWPCFSPTAMSTQPKASRPSRRGAPPSHSSAHALEPHPSRRSRG